MNSYFIVRMEHGGSFIASSEESPYILMIRLRQKWLRGDVMWWFCIITFRETKSSQESMGYLNDGQTYRVNLYEHACKCGKT